MAPGIEVARIDENKWAISARGFNGRFANKLLESQRNVAVDPHAAVSAFERAAKGGTGK